MQAPTRRRATPVAEEEGRLSEKPVESVESVGNVGFLCEVFLGFVFWSVLAEAVPALWYIPMNLMEISGLEPLLFLHVLPAVLTVRKIRDLIWNAPLLNLVGVLSLLTLYSPTVLVYGSTLMITNGIHMTVAIGQLLHPSPQVRERRVSALVLGLIALVTVRFGLSSVSPLFLYENANMFAIVLIVVASVILNQAKATPTRAPPASKASATLPHDLAVGAGFGAFLFLNIVFLSEHGVLARWDNAQPFTIGLGVLACMVIGLLISKQSFVRYVSHIILHFLS